MRGVREWTPRDRTDIGTVLRDQLKRSTVAKEGRAGEQAQTFHELSVRNLKKI